MNLGEPLFEITPCERKAAEMSRLEKHLARMDEHLICPTCKSILPINNTTLLLEPTGKTDVYGMPIMLTREYCTKCNEYFDNMKQDCIQLPLFD